MNWKQKKQEQKRLAKQFAVIEKTTVGGTIHREGFLELSDFMVTSDDWAPNYPSNLVKISLRLNHNHNNKLWHQVSVWGYDDFGMVKSFICDSTIEAIKCYYYILQLKIITVEKLIEIGFEML